MARKEHTKELLTELLAWFYAADKPADGKSDEIYEEIVSIIEKSESNECSGCKWESSVSNNAQAVCLNCCNNYYNQWAAKPKKTRQSEFLKIFPNAHEGVDGVLDFYPCAVDETLDTGDFPHGTGCDRAERYGGCYECRLAYWEEGITDED